MVCDQDRRNQGPAVDGKGVGAASRHCSRTASALCRGEQPAQAHEAKMSGLVILGTDYGKAKSENPSPLRWRRKHGILPPSHKGQEEKEFYPGTSGGWSHPGRP